MKSLSGLATPVLVLCTLLVLGACGATQRPSGTVRSTPDIIGRDQIISSSRGNVYDLIAESRPFWLQTRSEQTVRPGGGIIVYLNGNRFGDVQSLRQIPLLDVQEIRRFNPNQASQRWGPGHSDGVILVSTLINR